MSTIDFSRYLPQRVFLVQGNEDLFDQVVAEHIARDPLTQALSVTRFTIDHARSVAAFAVEGTGTTRAYIVYFSIFSQEAAQVLLKSLEEPAFDTTLIFITRHPYLVPQTVRSRLLLISSASYWEQQGDKNSVLQQIKREAEEKEDDAAARRSRAAVLLDILETAVRKDCAQALLVYKAKRMLLKENLPTKFVLDYIATVVR